MPTLMFKEMFAKAVFNGTKRQTIRPARKRPIKAGDKLSLRKWIGVAYRSPQVSLLEATCKRVVSIRIDTERYDDSVMIVDGHHLGLTEQIAMAEADGFSCLNDMRQWFRESHGLPFEGVLIQW
jgi:hypothetical protein